MATIESVRGNAENVKIQQQLDKIAQRKKVVSTIEKLTRFKEMKLGTATAKNLWIERLDYYIGFYEKLNVQLENSTAIR